MLKVGPRPRLHTAYTGLKRHRGERLLVLFQSLMVAKAKEELEQESEDKEDQKAKYLEEKAPPIQTGGLSLAELRVRFTLTTGHFARVANETGKQCCYRPCRHYARSCTPK